MSKQLRLLLVEDSPPDATLMACAFEEAGYELDLRRVETSADMEQALAEHEWDAVLADYRLPLFSAVMALETLKKSGKDIPFIVVSGTIKEATALEAMQLGAHDYVMKDNLAKLVPVVRREMSDAAVRREHRQANERLLQEEKRFRSMIEKSREAVTIVDGQGVILYATDATMRVLGYRPEEVAGRSCFEFLLPSDKAVAMDALQAVLENPAEARTFEVRGRRKDESLRWVEATMSNLVSEPGIHGVIINFHDITDRKQAEEENLRLVTALRERVKEQTCLYQCAKALQNLDQSPEEALKNVLPLIPSGWQFPERCVARVVFGDLQLASGEIGEVSRSQTAKFTTLAGQAGSVEVFYRAGGQDEDAEFLAEETVLLESLAELLRNYFEAIHARTFQERQERYYKALIEATTDLVSLLDARGNIKYESPSLARLLGWQPAELIGQSAFGLVHPEDAPKVLEVFSRGAGDFGRIDAVEYRYQHKEGGWRVMESIARNLLQDPDIAAIVVNSRDITERKNTEEALRRSEERFRYATRATREVLWEWDMQTDAIWWSEALADRTKYEPHEIEPTLQWWQDRVHPEDIDRVSSELKASVENKDPRWVSEYRFRTRSGSYLNLLDQGYTIYSEGQPTRMIGAMMDVTEKAQMEARFLRAQRMESIGTLAGGISHDLNNVLAPILMCIEMLRGDLTEAERNSILNTIEASTRRGADLVKQVLSFARGVEGKRIPLMVSHLAGEVRKIVRETFPKDITFSVEFQKGLWPVLGDPTQLHQVLMNLCVNARDAMPHGGTLALSLKNSVLDSVYSVMCPDAKAGSYVEIQVRDTGTGIAPEIRDRIFDPFFTTKEVGKGTGLGLATTLAIVKSHGGFINLTSAQGRGTTFSIYIPAAPEEARGEEEALKPVKKPRAGSGELILVIDDEQSVREVTKLTLERFGYTTLLAGNGAEGVALYSKHAAKIALVITDMMMPIMDGPTTIVALKSINPAVKIIASTGQISKEGAAQALPAGVARLVPKPYTAEVLLQALDEVLHEPAPHR